MTENKNDDDDDDGQYENIIANFLAGGNYPENDDDVSGAVDAAAGNVDVFAYPKPTPIPIDSPVGTYVRKITPFKCDFCDAPQNAQRKHCEHCGTSYDECKQNVYKPFEHYRYQ